MVDLMNEKRKEMLKSIYVKAKENNDMYCEIKPTDWKESRFDYQVLERAGFLSDLGDGVFCLGILGVEFVEKWICN